MPFVFRQGDLQSWLDLQVGCGSDFSTWPVIPVESVTDKGNTGQHKNTTIATLIITIQKQI